MDVMKKRIVDHEVPLANDSHEGFCSEYVRLDIEDGVVNKRMRRIIAYRHSYPETFSDSDAIVSSRATALLAKKVVKDRIKALYEDEGTSVENEFTWTKSKSEGLLVEIAYDNSQKAGDRIKAIGELNKMRGIDIPKVVEEVNEGDSVDQFFAKFKGMVENG
ncbi:MAG: hypothetical protein ACRCX2_02145 [Paraclostridium sp.]